MLAFRKPEDPVISVIEPARGAQEEDLIILQGQPDNPFE
jgi:hypothetical protein